LCYRFVKECIFTQNIGKTLQLRHFIYPGFIVFCLLVFWRTIDYGYATDYLGWLNRYREGGWKDIFTSFGYPGLHQVFHLFNFILFKLFGSNVSGLGIVFIIAHASTSYLIYRTFRLLIEKIDEDKGGLISIFTGMLFALSPYSIEVVTWDACFHYILCTSFVFGSLYSIIQFFETQKITFLLLHFLLWILSLLTIELSLVAPAIFILYSGIYLLNSKQNLKETIYALLKLVPWYLLLIAIYFLTTRWVIGSWVGHYGAEKHLNFDLTLLVSTLGKYITKIGLFVHHWPFTLREKVYGYFDQKVIAWMFLSIIFLGLFCYYFFKRPKIKFYLPLVGFIVFCISMLPVLNLFFLWVVTYENDRYSYFAAPHFLLMISAIFVYGIKKWYWVVFLLYVTLSGIFLGRMTKVISEAGEVTRGLVENFDFYNEREIVFLCIPENLKGAYLFRDYSDENITFNETLDWLKNGQLYSGITHNIAQFNLTSQFDSVSVQVIDKNKVRVNIASWGTWFWRKGVGLSSFENEEFKVTTGELHFVLEDKFPEKKRLFLYTVGDKWRSVRLRE
jgi:hypothetical protein